MQSWLESALESSRVFFLVDLSSAFTIFHFEMLLCVQNTAKPHLKDVPVGFNLLQYIYPILFHIFLNFVFHC